MNIQIPQGPVTDANDNITLEWFLFMQSLITLSNGSGWSAADLAVQQAFDTDNTSQVADLQAQIKKIPTGDSPFAIDSNATADTAIRRLDSVETALDFMPSSSGPAQYVPDMPVMPSGNVALSNVGSLMAFSARHG